MERQLGDIGSFSYEMNTQFYFWRAVKHGISKKEIEEEWDLEDLDKFNAMLDWERDCETAVNQCLRDETNTG